MKRLVFLPLLFLALAAMGKSVRIPSYKSFVYWIQGSDTVYCENNTLMHEAESPDGTVIVRVRHEDWRDIVTEKSIARLAPWHAAMSRCTGIRAILSQGKPNTDAMMSMKKIPGMMPNALSINNLSNQVEDLDLGYACEYMIENTGTHEIVINDLNRGLVWYVPPKSYLLLNMGSMPQACLLRISSVDPQQPSVKYVTIGSASYFTKFTAAYEDDDCWIFLLDEETEADEDALDFSRMLGYPDHSFRTHYVKRDKDTFQDTQMWEAEVFAIIKAAKEARELEKKKAKEEKKK